MTTELNLRFPDADHFIVRLGAADDGSGQLDFTSPFSDKDLRDIRWYVETYGAHSLGDPDDSEAKRIAGLLPEWGKALFDAVFSDREAQRRFNEFQDTEDDTRLLTISAEHPAILGLPWELLHDPASGGGFLFMENPRISIRRRVSGVTGGRKLYTPEPKDALHILFVVSRPAGAGFLDPRADARPVLDAIDRHAPGRVTHEFLRPPTLDALLERLEDKSQTAVDVVHFDGHGIFDRHGNLPNRAAKITQFKRLQELLRQKKADIEEIPVDPDCPPDMGYLLFEDGDGNTHFVSADRLGQNLHRHRVALVILSACQSAAVGEKKEADDGEAERPMGSVAARLTATGIPSVLAMTHSVLVATTRVLFGEFYKHLAQHKGIGESLDNARRHLANHPEKYEVQRGPRRVPLKLYDWFLPALYQPGSDGALLKEWEQTDRSLGPLSRASRTGQWSHPTVAHNLPAEPEAGFFGRRRDLWHIERWFAGPTRRITITGFGGQGKTALAQEAGRWLTRTGLFQAAVFVDYARMQGADAVAVAKNEIGRVLDQTLLDADAATAVLQDTPTLVILDNLEALADDTLRALLDAAVAWSEAGGSRVLCTTRRPEFGHAEYRVEGTHRHRRIQLDGLGDKDFPDDALQWFAGLMKLPPAPTVPAPRREALIELFDRVRFHPLSIRVLAQQLKTRRIAEVGERLDQLLSDRSLGPLSRASRTGQWSHPTIAHNLPEIQEDTPAGLIASLELSLDKLDDEARQVLPRLGVFQGGAMEDLILKVTGLGIAENDEAVVGRKMLEALESRDPIALARAVGIPLPDGTELPDEVVAQLHQLVEQVVAEHFDRLAGEVAKTPTPELLAGADETTWPTLRRQLEAAALVEAEDLPGVSVPFVRFHPTLAPLLWAQLDGAERERLGTAHRQRYYALSGYLYHEDKRNPHQARAIAWRELPNLLHAVHAALDEDNPAAGDLDAGTFAEYVNKFLRNFGLKQEAERLSAKVHEAAEKSPEGAGSRAWYLAQSNRGEQLLASGRVAEVFAAILQQLGDAPSYERALTLGRLGRCFLAGGRPDVAEQHARDAIEVCDQIVGRALLPVQHGDGQTDGQECPSYDSVKRLRGNMLTDLADALAEQGKYAEARQAYLDSLEVKREFGGDLRGEGVVLGQLGTLAMREGNLPEAADRYRAALALFQQLREPAMEAVVWHQLGMVFQESRQWDEAERHYRESARIKEENGNLAGAAQTWNNLAVVSKNAGKPDAAEMWYRKAIEGGQQTGDSLPTSRALSNLADLLQTQPGRLAEARELAEEALAIDQTLDAGAAEIWTTHTILAQISEREAEEVEEDSLKAGLQQQARDHRRLAREAQRNFAGTRHQLQQLAPVIVATIGACNGEPEGLEAVKRFQPVLAQIGPEGQTLSSALDRILAGERDDASLCEQLGPMPSMIIETILAGLSDPATLQDLLPPEPDEGSFDE